MASSLIPQEPIDQEIVRWLSECPSVWSPVDEEHLSFGASDALKLVVRAGMAEGRLRLRFQMDGRPETLLVRLCVSGEYSGRQVFQTVAPHLPDGWLDANGRTCGRLRVKASGFAQIRLTDQGELARQDLVAGKKERVVSFVRRSGFFQSRPVVNARVRVEDVKTRTAERADSGPGTERIVAQAHASVGDIQIEVNPTIHVNPTVHVHLDNTQQTRAKTPAEPSEKQANSPEPPAWVFAHDGSGYWIAGFGESGHLPGWVGFQHIEALLREVGKPVPMLTLVRGPEAEDSTQSERTRQPVLDKTAREQIRIRLAEYDQDIEQAEAERRYGEAQILREEKEALLANLKPNLGLGGKSRDLNSLSDKLRPRIHSALKRAYGALRNAKPPLARLAEHFELSIRSEGPAFVYAPQSPPAWSFDRQK